MWSLQAPQHYVFIFVVTIIGIESCSHAFISLLPLQLLVDHYIIPKSTQAKLQTLQRNSKINSKKFFFLLFEPKDVVTSHLMPVLSHQCVTDVMDYNSYYKLHANFTFYLVHILAIMYRSLQGKKLCWDFRLFFLFSLTGQVGKLTDILIHYFTNTCIICTCQPTHIICIQIYQVKYHCIKNGQALVSIFSQISKIAGFGL